jgi:diketogulonate reductase-like aldo/keto reductase
VSRALKAGMRLIDTARVYDVEKQVGRGIKRSGIPRGEIFLGTKLWCNDYHPDDVEKALDESLADLDTPYVDLFLMHYPCTFARGRDRFPRDNNGNMILGETNFVDTWLAMEQLAKTGKAKAIGVSNFSKGELETLIKRSATVSPPMAGNRTPDVISVRNQLTRPEDTLCSPDGSSSLSAAKVFQQVASFQGHSCGSV